jgi:hypothetical protein
MCAVFKFQNKIFKPGGKITARSQQGDVNHVWAGFARHEILDWWLKRGGIILDIHADSFAEISDQTRRLIWDIVPENHVIRGVLDLQSSDHRIKIVTRSATNEETKHFHHPRMPLLALPLFGATPPEVEDWSSARELF